MLKECPECGGSGEIEVERIRPMSFTNPCGDIYCTWEVCDWCDGSGDIEVEDDEDE